jgi:hypothetical protein
MTPDQLRTVIAWLEQRIRCARTSGVTTVTFDPPTAADLVPIGVDEGDGARLLAAPWWPEMVADIVGTPAFCGADEDLDTVLRYARDVVGEYLRKRFTP